MPKIVEKHLSLWKEQIFFPKNIFIAKFKIVQNIHYFCKVRHCRKTVKNSIFQKLPNIVENTSFGEWNN